MALDIVRSTYPIPKQRTYTKIRKFYVHIKFEVVTILSDNDVSKPSPTRRYFYRRTASSAGDATVRAANLRLARTAHPLCALKDTCTLCAFRSRFSKRKHMYSPRYNTC